MTREVPRVDASTLSALRTEEFRFGLASGRSEGDSSIAKVETITDVPSGGGCYPFPRHWAPAEFDFE